MPKRKSYKNLSKSQKNKRLRNFYSINFENPTDAFMNETGELSSCIECNYMSEDECKNDESNLMSKNIDGIELNGSEVSYDSDAGHTGESDMHISAIENRFQEHTSADISLSTTLAQWVNDYNITRDASNKLLQILNKFSQEEISNLPLDTRTLLGTPETPIVTREVPPGEYFHYGLKNALIDQFSLIDYHTIPNLIVININIDGLPIAKSSTSQLYPILAQMHPTVSRPFVIGIYHGYEKPKSCQLYLQEFLDFFRLIS